MIAVSGNAPIGTVSMVLSSPTALPSSTASSASEPPQSAVDVAVIQGFAQQIHRELGEMTFSTRIPFLPLAFKAKSVINEELHTYSEEQRKTYAAAVVRTFLVLRLSAETVQNFDASITNAVNNAFRKTLTDQTTDDETILVGPGKPTSDTSCGCLENPYSCVLL